MQDFTCRFVFYLGLKEGQNYLGTDADLIAIGEHVLSCNFFPVEDCAVNTAKIFNEIPILPAVQAGMAAGDFRVVDHEPGRIDAPDNQLTIRKIDDPSGLRPAFNGKGGGLR